MQCLVDFVRASGGTEIRAKQRGEKIKSAERESEREREAVLLILNILFGSYQVPQAVPFLHKAHRIPRHSLITFAGITKAFISTFVIISTPDIFHKARPIVLSTHLVKGFGWLPITPMLWECAYLPAPCNVSEAEWLRNVVQRDPLMYNLQPLISVWVACAFAIHDEPPQTGKIVRVLSTCDTGNSMKLVSFQQQSMLARHRSI